MIIIIYINSADGSAEDIEDYIDYTLDVDIFNDAGEYVDGNTYWIPTEGTVDDCLNQVLDQCDC